MKKLLIFKFILICISFLLCGISLSLLSPFYPDEAHRVGLTDFESGVVFGSAFLTTMIVTPLAAGKIDMFGADNFLVIGETAIIVCSVLKLIVRSSSQCSG